MFWVPDIKACPPTLNRLLQFHLDETWGMDKYKLGVISQERLKIDVKLLLSANSKSYMPRRLTKQRMTLSDRRYLCGS